MFKEHEKFWAFLMLIFSIVLMAWMARNGEEHNSLRDAIIGLIGIAGAAGQSLFRHSSTEEKVASAALLTAEKVPPVTGEAKAEAEEDAGWTR